MPSNNIVSINDELFNYLNDVNYGMSKLQFNCLTTIDKKISSFPTFTTLLT